MILTCNFAIAATLENSKNFAGPAIAIGGSSVATHSKLKHHLPDENSEFSVGDNKFVAVLNGSYLKDITDKWLIGGGVTYDLNSMSNHNAHYYLQGVGTYDSAIRISDHFSIYAQPTYALSPTTALFFKAAYHQAKVRISDSYFYTANTNQKNDLHGFGLGIGAMIFLDKDIFTKLELEYVDYAKVTIPYNTTKISYRLSTTSGTLSIGYRF